MPAKITDPKEFARRKAIVEASESMSAAARQIGTEGAALDHWFRSRGHDPKAWLKKREAPPPPVDPVARRQEETRQARFVREHKALADEVARLREVVATRDALASAPLPAIKRRELGSGFREGTFVALASDWHVEERVRPGDTPTGNAYNLAIADLRIGRFFSAIEWQVAMCRERFKVRDGILWLGGDLMSGHIHDENVETSALSPIATLLWLQPRLVAGVRQLLDRLELEQLQVVCSYGNHGRDTKKPRRATGAHHSYEWGMYQQIAALFVDEPRVRVLADPSAHQYAHVYDFDLHFHHGDETNYQGGVGGITIPINKAVAAWDVARRCHYHNFGHWHQYVDLDNWAGNGSLIGFNAYAMAIKARPEKPRQAFYLLDSKEGKTVKCPLWVGKPEEEKKLWRDVA